VINRHYRGQSIYYDNALYISDYYSYFIKGADVPSAMLVYIDNSTISIALLKRDATLKPRTVINMIILPGIIMLVTGGFL